MNALTGSTVPAGNELVRLHRKHDEALPVVFVINLDRAPGRMAATRERLAGVGIPHVRVSAIDGATTPPEAAAALGGSHLGVPRRRPLGPAETACYASHLMVLRYIVAEALPGACILEDDVELVGDLRSALLGLRRLDPIAAVIKLEGLSDGRRRSGIVVDRIGGADLVAPLRTSVGAAAYYVTAGGARAVLDLCREMTAPYDVEIADRERLSASMLELRPFPVRQVKGPVSYVRPDRITARLARRSNRRPLLVKLVDEITLPGRRLGRWARNRRVAWSTAIRVARSLGIKGTRLHWRGL